jgi:HSP20 family molecular chaperone IbpA
MNQNLIKNGLTFKTLGGGKKNIINNTINKNIANELGDCTLSSITEYYKKKKIRNLHNSNKYHNNNNNNTNNVLNGPKATFCTMLNEYKIIIHLNGITRRDIKLDLVGNYFIILCEKTKNGLGGDETNINNKFCYYKKSFKLPNDSEPESMQAKLFEDRLEISINRINNFQNSPTSLSSSNENENHLNKDIEREEKINIKKNNALSETNIVKLVPSRKIKSFSSDTNLFYYNNKNKILSINPSSFTNPKKIPSKLNQLEFSSIIPQNNMLRKKTISELSLNPKRESTTSSLLINLLVHDTTDSGWTLVTRRRQNKRNKNLLPSLESQNKSNNNLKPCSFSYFSSPRNSTDNLMKPLKPKLHYRDPNNLYSPLYISSDSSMAFSDSRSSVNSSRNLSHSFILLRKSNSSTFSSSSNNKFLKERSSSGSKICSSSNKKLNSSESQLSLSKSKKSINERNKISSKEDEKMNKGKLSFES